MTTDRWLISSGVAMYGYYDFSNDYAIPTISNDYQWLALYIKTENFKDRYIINTGLRYDAPTYLAEDYEKNIIIYGKEAKALMNKISENVIIKGPVRDGNIALIQMFYNVFLLKFFNILDLKLKI